MPELHVSPAFTLQAPELTKAQLIEIESVVDLALAEVMLDALAAGFGDQALAPVLRERAQAFIDANPQLLQTPWKRSAGAVFDLIEQAKAQA